MPEVLADRLRRGLDLDDEAFDRLYPDWGRSLSRIHWTPVEAARHAAQMLVTRPGTRILDVGSGVGKFAIIGALVTEGVFYGVEQRLHFVETARAVAGQLGAERARFIHGNMMALDWRMFDAFYLYNPFLENLGILKPLDFTTKLTPALFTAYIEFVRQQLRNAPVGTRVVTYHGFGGDLPSNYRLQAQRRCASDFVELWVSVREGWS
jgi:SAM-dependent methyltransferase